MSNKTMQTPDKAKNAPRAAKRAAQEIPASNDIRMAHGNKPKSRDDAER